MLRIFLRLGTSHYYSDRKIGKGEKVEHDKPNSQLIKNQYRHRDVFLLDCELYIYSPKNSGFNS